MNKTNKKSTHFTFEERVKIEIVINEGYGTNKIAKRLNRSKSSISDEIRRNSVKGIYTAKKAHQKAYQRRWRARHQHLKVAMNDILREYIEEKLKVFWSPEAISGRITYVETHLPSVGKDAVYAFVKSVYGRNLEQFLWYKRKKRRTYIPRSKLNERTFIDERPKSIEKRRFFGDWEADFIVSGRKGKGALLVLVERKSRYVIILKLMDRKAATINFILDQLIGAHLFVKSVTIDNDICFRHHKEMSKILNAPIFFCHPYHSWEKGSIEKINQMIRRFIPKGTNISKISNKKISKVQEILNGRPYKCLGFHTPKEVASRSPKLITFAQNMQRSNKLAMISKCSV